MSRLESRKTFSQPQQQQHAQLGNQLRKANAQAAQGLLTLRRLRPDRKETEQLYARLANIVQVMNLLIGCCQQIASNGIELQITRINVVIGLVCEHCEEMGRTQHPNSGRDNIKHLEADRAWGLQVDDLLSLTNSIIKDIDWSEYCSRPETMRSSRCLADLVNALLRQRRHLERIGGRRRPELAVVYDRSEVCTQCGHRKRRDNLVYDDDAIKPGIP